MRGLSWLSGAVTPWIRTHTGWAPVSEINLPPLCRKKIFLINIIYMEWLTCWFPWKHRQVWGRTVMIGQRGLRGRDHGWPLTVSVCGGGVEYHIPYVAGIFHEIKNSLNLKSGDFREWTFRSFHYVHCIACIPINYVYVFMGKFRGQLADKNNKLFTPQTIW